MKDFKKTVWKDLAKSKSIKNIHFVQRAILVAVRARSNSSKEEIAYALLQKYFTPITNTNKLNNGCTKFGNLKFLLVEACYEKTILGVDPTEIFDDVEEEKEYHALLKGIDTYKLKRRKYVYYFTIQDQLDTVHQGVQAAHAMFALGYELAKLGIDVNPYDTYFQWIGVKNQVELLNIINKHQNTKHVKFIEPDIGNVLTSAAFFPVYADKRRQFLDYQLLTH